MLTFPRFVSIPVVGALLISTGQATIVVTHDGIKTMPSAIADFRYVLGPPGAHGGVKLVRNETGSTAVGDVLAHYLGKSASS